MNTSDSSLNCSMVQIEKNTQILVQMGSKKKKHHLYIFILSVSSVLQSLT